MAETSYLSSDEESGEVQLANDWLKQAINKEVFRGKKLRERKLGPLDVTSKNSKPPTPAPARSICKDRRKTSSSPNRSNGFDQLRGRARSNSPFQSTRTKSPLSRDRDSSSTSARRGRPMCSMRISELAAPTKRQCIDTWRKKAGVLPEPMVHRLKQHVMDQTPIVKVSDAVNCFSQSSSVTSKKRPPRKINKEAMINRNKEETQYISSIFGHKIAQKLIRPVNAKLNSQLQNVSLVISSEICNIIDKPKLKTDPATHERMVRETADKVTIWIANILEETSEKLLEEDLKVKRFHERTSFVTDGDLITVIGMIMCQEAELEEQEGPALDILDDLVDNVVSERGVVDSDLDIFDAGLRKSVDNISTTDYVSVSSGNNDETDTKAISLVQQALKEYLDESDKKSVDEEESLKNDLIRQLNEIIDSNVIDTLKITDSPEKLSIEIDKQTESQSNMQENRPESASISLPNKDSQMDKTLLVDNQEHDREQIIFEKEATNQFEKADSRPEKEAKLDGSLNNENNSDNSNETAETKAHSDKIDHDHDKAEDSIFLLANDQVTDNMDEQKLNINEEQKPNTHEEQKSNMSVELSEDRDKKVQFSYDNFGTVIEIKDPIHSIHKIPEINSGLLEQGGNKGPSHDNLLRNVDEPWPEDLSFENLTKPGASVSKSVTSLGKILESDERNWLSPEESLSEKDQALTSHLNPESIEQFNNFGVNYEDFLTDNDNNRNEKQSTALVEVNHKKNYNIEPKHDLEDRIKMVSGETDEHFDAKQAITTINQEEVNGETTDGQLEGTSGASKFHAKESVDQQELTSQIKGKEFEASLNQLKQEIKKMNIQKESSEQSLVSVMLSKLQKHGDKLQGMMSDREQSYSDITKMHKALSERSKSAPYSLKRKVNGKRPSRSEEMATKKFDYRVHPSTAPSWIRRGRGQGDLGGCPRLQGYLDTNGMRARELEIRKRCKDLDKILMKLEKWRSWLEYITKYITSLKEKAELNKPTPSHANKTIKCDCDRDRSKPLRSMEKDMWTKLNHRAKGGLKLYKTDETIKFKISPTPVPAKYCFTCGKKQIKRFSRSPTRK